MPLVSVQDAAQILLRGGLVALPTETVYGLAADATNEAAVRRIFAAKNRPSSNPLICHLPDIESILRYAEFVPDWTRAFWPGPLTVLLPHRGSLAPSVTAGSKLCAFRIPDHPLMQQVLNLTGRPLCAPSANTSGRVSPVTAAMVEEDLGSKIDGILDGGECQVGLESTIVEPVTEKSVHILRPGAVTREDLAEKGIQVLEGGTQKSPGQSHAHYAPQMPLVVLSEPDPHGLTAMSFDPGRTLFLSFDRSGPNTLDLTEGRGLLQAARGLYAAFHRASALGVDLLIADNPPAGGIGTAIRDRLLRAATFTGCMRGERLFVRRREAANV